MSKQAAKLPDLEDEDFQAKMQPLVERVLPSDRKSGTSNNRIEDAPDVRKTGPVSAAQHQERIELARGAKRRFEYLIPERVGRALAADATQRGISATTRLLEVLRDAGYPVIQEDLIDIRKLPKR